MTNVVNLNTHPARLRPGEMALHQHHGWVEILERSGSRRRIRWLAGSTRSLEASAPDEVDGGLLAVWEDWVDADTLKAGASPLLAHLPHTCATLLIAAANPW